MDAINEVMDSFSDRNESEGNSRSEISSSSNNQSDSSHEYSESEKESKSSWTQNESKYIIGPSISIRYSDFDNKSERKPQLLKFDSEKNKKHCFSYKNEKASRRTTKSKRRE